MNMDGRRRIPAWRTREVRAWRPGWFLVAAAVMGVLLLEVWQTATVKSLSMSLDEASRSLQQASANLEWNRAELERENTRSELGPVAASLGLKPVDPSQIVALPADYLADSDRPVGPAGSPTVLAWAGRQLQTLVPEATARGRRVN